MTQQEKNQAINEKAAMINELKCRLASTDYIGVKIAEGAATRQDYADKLNERQNWRDDINALENEMNWLQSLTPDEEYF
jgi:hypothetical protein